MVVTIPWILVIKLIDSLTLLIINVIGIPKTIDNDLVEIDHTPGYGSAAKYVKDTVEEIVSDNLSYRNAKVNIIEIMGRSAGWLAASSALAHLSGLGPDLIYLPETTFYIDDFIKNVKNIFAKLFTI